MQVLITGGAGFIGSHLAQFHLERGDSVWIVDNLSTGNKGNLAPFLNNPLFKFSQEDITTWDQLEHAVTWSDGIYHMAAIVGQKVVLKHPVSVLHDNIYGCERLLQSLATKNKKCRMLIASSSEVYGHDGESSFREDAPLVFPSSPCDQKNYSLSKYINERMALSYMHEYGIDCVIARLFNTIGANQTGKYGMVVPRFVEQALANRPLTVYGTGTQTRSFCDVRDVVTLLNSLMQTKAAKGQIFNVGNDNEISILALALLVKERVGSTSDISYVPYQEAYGTEFEDTIRRCHDLDKMRETFGFEPKWHLTDTLDWIIQTKSTAE